MASSYDRIILHTTFSTKYRQPIITEDIEEGLYGVIIASLRLVGSEVLAVGGIEDHIHIVHTLPRTKTVATLLNAVKSQSSGWVRKKGGRHLKFEWQEGYAVFSADYRKLDGLIRYVQNQKEHHKSGTSSISFREEITGILVAFGIQNFTPEYFLPDSPPPFDLADPQLSYKANRHRARRRRFTRSY